MNQIMQKKQLTIFGDGKQTRAFSYIGDMSFEIANSINIDEAKNQIFNVGADKEYSVNELAQAVSDAMDSELEIKHVEARNEVVHAWADHSKFNNVLKPIRQTSLEEGIKKMAEWAKKNGVQKTSIFKNIEITENLPPVWLE